MTDPDLDAAIVQAEARGETQLATWLRELRGRRILQGPSPLADEAECVTTDRIEMREALLKIIGITGHDHSNPIHEIAIEALPPPYPENLFYTCVAGCGAMLSSHGMCRQCSNAWGIGFNEGKQRG